MPVLHACLRYGLSRGGSGVSGEQNQFCVYTCVETDQSTDCKELPHAVVEAGTPQICRAGRQPETQGVVDVAA